MPSIRQILHKLNNKNTRLPKLNSNLIYLFLSLLIISILAFSAKTNFAQQTDRVQEIQSAQDEIALEGWLKQSFEVNIVNTAGTLIGPIPSIEELQNPETSYIPSGTVGTIANLSGQLYQPPASGIQYIAQIKNNLLGKPAYAQGMGFVGLQPILPLWKGFRNTVYILSSLIFIALGLMVMFRVKSSPQTIITIQNAIPQIIVTLLLVTFSYAIAGLIIDFTNLIVGAVLALLFQISNTSLNDNLLKQDLFQAIIPGSRYNFKSLIDMRYADFIELSFLAIPKLAILSIGLLLGATIGFIVLAPISLGSLTIPGAVAGAGIGGVIFIILVTILIMIWLTKFFFGGLKCYVTAIFKIILAPLEIGIGAFPNSKMGFSSWIIGLVANLAVFPISFLFLVLANMIVQESSGDLWAPNIINNRVTTNLFASISGGIVPIGIGISALMILSKLPELIPQAIFAIKPSPWGTAIGQTGKDYLSQPLASAKGLFWGEAGGPIIQEAGQRAQDIKALNRLKTRGGTPITQKAGEYLEKFGKEKTENRGRAR
ncbi:hypothetical protein KKE45_00350 [Patescibacteria group bacterium]|nr:hypothetical protein [Patescibacteria group bacterium]